MKKNILIIFVLCLFVAILSTYAIAGSCDYKDKHSVCATKKVAKKQPKAQTQKNYAQTETKSSKSNGIKKQITQQTNEYKNRFDTWFKKIDLIQVLKITFLILGIVALWKYVRNK